MSTASIARTVRGKGSAVNSLPIQRGPSRLRSVAASAASKAESPKFIGIPEAIQPPKLPSPFIKGILPVGRDILSRRKQYKASPEWLNQSAPQPKAPANSDVNQLERAAYASRMSCMRRRNIREGMKELYQRRLVTQEVNEKNQERQTLLQLQAVNAPQRHDSKWTQPSTPKVIRDILAQKDNTPKESQKSRAKRVARHERILEARKQERSDSLHALYLNAKDFILTEEKLDQELEKIFGADDNPAAWYGGHRSIWSLGPPPGSEQLAGKMPDMSTDLSRGKNFDLMSNIMRKRMMQIAGKLTGGDIPIPEDFAKRASRKNDLF